MSFVNVRRFMDHGTFNAFSSKWIIFLFIQTVYFRSKLESRMFWWHTNVVRPLFQFKFFLWSYILFIKFKNTLICIPILRIINLLNQGEHTEICIYFCSNWSCEHIKNNRYYWLLYLMIISRVRISFSNVVLWMDKLAKIYVI